MSENLKLKLIKGASKFKTLLPTSCRYAMRYANIQLIGNHILNL